MSFICMRMTNHLHIKGWALNLVLIQRPGGTRKWLIAERVHLTRPQSSLSLLLIDEYEYEYEYEIFFFRGAQARERAASFWGRGEARKYQELTFGFPCTEQPSARIHTRQKLLRRKKKNEKELALAALALLMYAFVRNQAVWVASTDKTNWRIIIRFWETAHLPLP